MCPVSTKLGVDGAGVLHLLVHRSCIAEYGVICHAVLHLDLPVVVNDILRISVAWDEVEVAKLAHILVVEHEEVCVGVVVVATEVGHEFPTVLWCHVVAEVVGQIRHGGCALGPRQYLFSVARTALTVDDGFVNLVRVAVAQVDGVVLAPVVLVEGRTALGWVFVDIVTQRLVARDGAGFCYLGGNRSLLDVEIIATCCESECENTCGKCAHEHLLNQILFCCHNFIYFYLFILIYYYSLYLLLIMCCPFIVQ